MRRFRLAWLLVAIAVLAIPIVWWIAVRMLHPTDPEAISLDQRNAIVRSELRAIAGRWQSTTVVVDDVAYAGIPWEHYFLFSRDRLFWYCMAPGVTGPDSNFPKEVRVNPNASPAKLDYIGGRSLWKGIYTRQGGVLRIVVAQSCEDRRPTTIDERSGAFFIELRRAEPDSAEFYEKRLLDTDFKWYGPCPEIDMQRPSLYAARALGFLGDAAVPALFRALRNKRIDLGSVVLALAEIGLPVEEYSADLNRRDTSRLEKWWAENGERTAAKRSQMRYNSGLPPAR